MNSPAEANQPERSSESSRAQPPKNSVRDYPKFPFGITLAVGVPFRQPMFLSFIVSSAQFLRGDLQNLKRQSKKPPVELSIYHDYTNKCQFQRPEKSVSIPASRETYNGTQSNGTRRRSCSEGTADATSRSIASRPRGRRGRSRDDGRPGGARRRRSGKPARSATNLFFPSRARPGIVVRRAGHAPEGRRRRTSS